MRARGARPLVSIILPVYNAEPWLDECLRSVLQQDFEGAMELSVFNDASQDKSMTIIDKWKEKLEESGILVVVGGHSSSSPRGVGYSKNQAIAQSSGSYLCFLDSDDVMMPQRVRLQHEAAAQHPTSIIGCQVRREPPNSTERYTRWVNQLAPDQLLTQDDHLDLPRALPGGAGPPPLVSVHHLECGQAGAQAVQEPHCRQPTQGGCLLRCG